MISMYSVNIITHVCTNKYTFTVSFCDTDYEIKKNMGNHFE